MRELVPWQAILWETVWEAGPGSVVGQIVRAPCGTAYRWEVLGPGHYSAIRGPYSKPHLMGSASTLEYARCQATIAMEDVADELEKGDG